MDGPLGNETHRHWYAPAAAAFAVAAVTATVAVAVPRTTASVTGNAAPVTLQLTRQERIRAAIQAELATHPDWPQRDVTVTDDGAPVGMVQVPFGPQDPPGYLAWVKGLGPRYGEQVATGVRYVADRPGVPTESGLATIRDAVTTRLEPLSVSADISMGTHVSPFDGAVVIDHERTADKPFLAALDSLRHRYGSLIKVTVTGPMIPA